MLSNNVPINIIFVNSDFLTIVAVETRTERLANESDEKVRNRYLWNRNLSLTADYGISVDDQIKLTWLPVSSAAETSKMKLESIQIEELNLIFFLPQLNPINTRFTMSWHVPISTKAVKMTPLGI